MRQAVGCLAPAKLFVTVMNLLCPWKAIFSICYVISPLCKP